MRKKLNMTMDEKDEEAVNIIIKLGHSKAKAKCYWFFQGFEEGTAREIEQTMNERQPAISLAIHELLHEGIIYIRYMIKEFKKGRPVIVYRRRKRPYDFIKQKAEEKIKHIKQQLSVLKELKFK